MIIQAEEMDDYPGRRDGRLCRQKRWMNIQVEEMDDYTGREMDDYTGRRDG